MKSYLKSLSLGAVNEDEINERAAQAYANVHSLCKFFLVAYFGDKFNTPFTWSSLDENVRVELVSFFECIVFFWNKRVGHSGFPTVNHSDLISVVDSHHPVLPLHLAKDHWMAQRIIVAGIQSNKAPVSMLF